ncbi:TolC family protein [Herbaspirillum sp. YR522]|uniref:TolC family protein n=1 Tax=Herbaspirillum sp. YR522 TaxID=1144342 RepID=UPI00026F90E0|nr:TolC family protein [Herbaspirillum sp. YR522]EJN07984.1 outer membrane protein [Herbaspirillum sp. YR522]
MRRPAIWLALLASTWAMQGRAHASAVLDLAGFVEQVERNDPGLAAAGADLVVGEHGRLRARAGFLPRVEASWTRGQSTQHYPGTSPVRQDRRERRITLTQPLLDWNAWGNYRHAQLQQARKQLQWLQAIQALRIKAVERYFAALQARDQAALERDSQAALQAQLAAARARLAAGAATLIDIADIEAELARAANRTALAHSAQQSRMRELETMLGQPIGALTGLPGALSMPTVYPDDLESWTSQAASSHPEVQLRELDLKLATLDIDRARTEFLPKASLQAGHVRNGTGAGGWQSAPTSSHSISVQITIPLFSGLESVHGVRQGLAQQEKALHQVQQARRQAADEAGDSFSQAQAQRRSIDDLQQLVVAAQGALEATRIGYRVGSRRESDLLRKQNELWIAQRELLRARYEALVHGLRLKALTASLDVADIRAVNALLALPDSRP